MLRRLKQCFRMRAQGNDNSNTDQQSGLTAQAEETDNASKDENSEEINGVSRYIGQRWSSPRGEDQIRNARLKPQEIPMEWVPYVSRPRTLDKPNEKDIDGSVLPRRLNRSTDKKKLQRVLFGKDNETETTYCQIGSTQRLSSNEISQSEQTIREEEWPEALRFRLNQNEEKLRNQKQDGKQESDSTVEESDEKKNRRREILQALEKGQPYKEKAALILGFTKPFSDLDANLAVEDLYGLKNNDELITFEQKKPGRMCDADKWKKTDVRFKTGGISQPFKGKEPKSITYRDHVDENRHQSSASNPCNRGEQLISGPSKEKYSYLPQFHEGLQSSGAGVFGNSEKVEGLLVGGREKLQEIRRELDSDSHARSADEIHKKEFTDNSSEIHEKDLIDDSVACMSQGYSPKKRKLFTLWDVDIYKEDVGDSPQDSQSSKPKNGSTDEHDV